MSTAVRVGMVTPTRTAVGVAPASQVGEAPEVGFPLLFERVRNAPLVSSVHAPLPRAETLEISFTPAARRGPPCEEPGVALMFGVC